MAEEQLGETSRELFSQFLWRVNRQFSGKEAHLAMFSTLKYINSNNDQKLREKIFQATFEAGFCFPAKAFHGNKGNFPVGFLIWNLSRRNHLENQEIQLDIFDTSVQKIGWKSITSITRESFLSKWVTRPRTTEVMPPFSNAITVALGRKDVRDRVAPGFLCSLMCAGNDYQHQNVTYLLPGPSVSAGAFSVVPENFEQSMVVHAVRMVRKANWLNDRDQWMQPTVNPLPESFITNCVVWSLFAGSNQAASIPDVVYGGKTFKITNSLFPFLRTELQQWEISLRPLVDSFGGRDTDRFAANWLTNRELSSKAQVVLDIAKRIYRIFYQESSSLNWPKFKISSWDAGWYQIRRALIDAGLAQEELSILSDAHKALGLDIVLNRLDPDFLLDRPSRATDTCFEISAVNMWHLSSAVNRPQSWMNSSMVSLLIL
jgi:hypothetical protein